MGLVHAGTSLVPCFMNEKVVKVNDSIGWMCQGWRLRDLQRNWICVTACTTCGCIAGYVIDPSTRRPSSSVSCPFRKLRTNSSAMSSIIQVNNLQQVIPFQLQPHTSILPEYKLILYQSIALEPLYNFGFGCKMIGRLHWPQFRKNWKRVLEFAHLLYFTCYLPAKITLGSGRSQKSFDRTLKELSIGVKTFKN